MKPEPGGFSSKKKNQLMDFTTYYWLIVFQSNQLWSCVSWNLSQHALEEKHGRENSSHLNKTNQSNQKNLPTAHILRRKY